MASFNYSVRDRSGKIVKGKLDGDNKEAVQAKLVEMGYIILELSPKSGLAALGDIKIGGGTVKPKEVTVFARQFSTMINAGLSLTKCLSILQDQAESDTMRDTITQLTKDVEAGQSLSEALARHPKIFPKLFVSMVRAGETGGVLDEVLNRLADYFEADADLKARIKSAMTYPVAMFALVLIILAAMMIFVVPTFEKMFADAGSALPLPTQILVNVSNFVTSPPGWIAAGVAVAAFFAFKNWAKGPGLKLWDGVKLNMPVFGPIVRKMVMARFTRTFGTLVAAGVPMLSALDIVADTSGNEVVAEEVRGARSAIKEGEPLAKPLSESKVFPSMLVQMVAVGEETGALDAMLNKVADFYDSEVSATVDGLTSIIEPLIMAFMGIMVGFVVIALYMPMFQSVTLVQ